MRVFLSEWAKGIYVRRIRRVQFTQQGRVNFTQTKSNNELFVFQVQYIFIFYWGDIGLLSDAVTNFDDIFIVKKPG